MKTGQQAKRETIQELKRTGIMDFAAQLASTMGAFESVSIERQDDSGEWQHQVGYEQQYHIERYVSLNRVCVIQTKKEVWIAEMSDGGLWWLKDSEIDGRFIKHYITKPIARPSNTQMTVTKLIPETGY